MTPLHKHGITAGTKGQKQGRNPQAQEFLRHMLAQGLIEQRTDENGEVQFSMTDKGAEVARQYQEGA